MGDIGCFSFSDTSIYLFSVNNTNKDRMTFVSICVAKWKAPIGCGQGDAEDALKRLIDQSGQKE